MNSSASLPAPSPLCLCPLSRQIKCKAGDEELRCVSGPQCQAWIRRWAVSSGLPAGAASALLVPSTVTVRVTRFFPEKGSLAFLASRSDQP